MVWMSLRELKERESHILKLAMSYAFGQAKIFPSVNGVSDTYSILVL